MTSIFELPVVNVKEPGNTHLSNSELVNDTACAPDIFVRTNLMSSTSTVEWSTASMGSVVVSRNPNVMNTSRKVESRWASRCTRFVSVACHAIRITPIFDIIILNPPHIAEREYVQEATTTNYITTNTKV